MFHERVNDIQQFWNFLNLIDKDPVETDQAGKVLKTNVLLPVPRAPKIKKLFDNNGLHVHFDIADSTPKKEAIFGFYSDGLK